MWQWLLRRLLIALPVLLGITIVTFAMVRAIPGDPIRISLDPIQAGGPAGEQYIENRRLELGLDQPLPVQYLGWLSAASRFDFGYSFKTGRPVSSVIGERIGPTVGLMGAALAIGVLVAVVVGPTAAVRQYSIFDHVATLASLTMISVPQFFIGLVAIYFLSITLHVLPTGGMSTAGAPADPIDVLKHYLMPGTILGLSLAGPLVRYTRSSVLETLHMEYLTTARAKGIKERSVLFVHSLPNALIPLITVVGLQVPLLVSGAVVVETIFQWPGMGQLLFSAFLDRDYPVLSAFVLLVAVMVLASRILTDLLYAVVDPRIRHA